MNEVNKLINIRYYALLREHAGKTSENIVRQANTTRELYIELASKYNFPMNLK